MFRILALALIMLTASFTANAEIAAPKIVVVDINKIMNDSKAAKNLNSQLEAKRKEFQSQIDAQEKKLKAAEQDLIKQKSVLSKDALEQKQKQFVADLNKARKDVAEKKTKLENAYRASLNTIQQNLQSVIDKMAAEQGFNIAIPSSQLIYANKGLDVTAEALKRLDTKLPSIALKL